MLYYTQIEQREDLLINKTIDTLETILAMVMILALGCVIVYFVCCGQHDPALGVNLSDGQYYALTTQVVEIDAENDAVIVEDSNGNLWEFYGAEDWQVGDCASLIMNSRGTVGVEDDKIEDARYSAWTLTH